MMQLRWRFCGALVAWATAAAFGQPAGGSTAPVGTGKPQSLINAEEARANHRLRTARLEMVQTWRAGGITHTRFRTWKSAGNDVIVVDHGDEHGVAQRDAVTGQPAKIDYAGPMSFLVQGDRIWLHVEESPLAKILPPDQRGAFNLWDYRRLGIDPDTPGESIETAAAAHGVTTHYSEGTEGDLVWVRNEVRGGAFTWWIDPQRDWSVVRTTTDVRGQRVAEARYTLEQVDGAWFPVRVEEYDLDVDPLKPMRVSEIMAAEFNRPDHPQRFTPADVGIEPGTQVSFLSPDPTIRAQGPMWWDGGQLIPGDEYQRRVSRGEFIHGPTVAREHARLLARSAARAQADEALQPMMSTSQPARIDPLGEWERYTLAFIEKHRLDEGQRERAFAILRDCREIGNVHLTRARDRIARFEEHRREIQDSASSGATQLEAMERERRALLEPLDRIFDERLKPRLDTLLTTEQRNATSQPATRPPRAG